MPPARPRPRAGLPRARPRPSRRGLASARLWACWRWRCRAAISAWGRGGIAARCLRLAQARLRTRGRVQSRPRPRLLPWPAEHTGGAAASAASAAASPARAPPLGSVAAGPGPPVPRSEDGTPGHGRPGAGEGRSGAVAGPGPSADCRVPPAGKAQEALQERHRLGSLLGRAPGTAMEQRAPRVPKLACVELEEEERPGATAAQDTEEVVPFHPPQEDAALKRTQDQERTRGLFRRTAQVPAATPTWAGPAVPAQPSTVCAALHAISPASCPSATDGCQIHEVDSGGRDQCHGHSGQSVPSHLQNQHQCCPPGYACGGGSFQS
ncbi:uncharacterized protein LOC141728047 [Zonotrichia albicollis]|uniref:uncharacterized protein LOC141728047 n=1 Tax=Zonotrichia albicollis TaxID=44394 RepID=UPI003D80BBCA